MDDIIRFGYRGQCPDTTGPPERLAETWSEDCQGCDRCPTVPGHVCHLFGVRQPCDPLRWGNSFTFEDAMKSLGDGHP
jgi:hypothetical protein